jgi:hypothetical protein
MKEEYIYKEYFLLYLKVPAKEKMLFLTSPLNNKKCRGMAPA